MIILKRIAVFVVVITVAISFIMVGLWAINAPDELAKSSQSYKRLNQLKYSVGKIKLEFEDLCRETPAAGEFDGDVKRTLNGTIWFPKESSSDNPLIVFSHGFGSDHKGCQHIAEYLAGNGYVVAAVDFPLSNRASPAGSPQLMDVANQPGDVSAVIDQVLKLNSDSDSELHQRVDPKKVGAMGFSLGGMTTALASFHPDLKDDRISAAVMMAPLLESFSDKFYAINSKVQSLVLSGTLDRVVPEKQNAIEVRERHPRGWFISLDKGSHLGFANIGNPIRWMENPDSLGCKSMDMMLSELDLPERWSSVLPTTGGVMREVIVAPPCPELSGKAMNGLEQQWITRIAIGSFFDMHLRSGQTAKLAKTFFTKSLSAENPSVSLISPRQ